MKHFVSLPPRQRADFFARYEQLNRVHPVISEKDFWVCWLLGLIFASPALGANAVFKGGTSLSKVFGVIDRFSEDIDLGLSPASLGWPESELDDAPPTPPAPNAWPRSTPRAPRPWSGASCRRWKAWFKTVSARNPGPHAG
jgi:hypothetical protein